VMQGEADFWVVLKDRADLSEAAAIADWNERGEFVYQRLIDTAEVTQSSVRATLDRDNASYQKFWIANVIYVKGGSEELAEKLVADASVERIEADETLEIAPVQEGHEEEPVNGVEWGVDRIRAPLAWSTFDVRGEGIVVANIDTGVDHTHPALTAQYRGTRSDGSFDHNYNWFDPSSVCSPGTPCDNNRHGTHTMGTMVGEDGDSGANQIGVAPHATWIAAKGCESSSCSRTALLASGQWLVAPTDLDGNNPRPDLRPHVVNNSWGGSGGRTFYQDIVDSWVASGIFPAFSAGNSGPFCGTAGSPGDYVNSYASGAFDIGNTIAWFSSRGPSYFGGTKPNLAAPGVNVRSSVPGGGYSSLSGTSMASPHTAGVVALIWSSAPSLIGDIDDTRALLDQTAVDVNNTSCGGSAENNNVFGEGRLDAFQAVDHAPRGPTGYLAGTVTAVDGGGAVEGARVTITGSSDRATVSDGSGAYNQRLLVGTYTVTVSSFGYLDSSVSEIIITEDETTVQDIVLTAAPSHPVSGHVYDDNGDPVANATVIIQAVPIAPVTTDESGFYHFASVPEGQYQLMATAMGRCFDSQVLDLTVDGDERSDFHIPRRIDEYGYYCETPTPEYIEASNILALTGDDSSTSMDLPFGVHLYGQIYNQVHVCANGYVSFSSSLCLFYNGGIPSSFTPNAAIYPFWDDLYVDASASVRTELLGTAPERRFVIEWRNVRFHGDSTRRVDFEVVFSERSSHILLQYRNIAADSREKGSSATLGIEDGTGSVAFQYSRNQAVIDDSEFALQFKLPPSATVQGTVIDYNDGLGVNGATVRFLDADGNQVHSAITGDDGSYQARLFLGSYDLEVHAEHYSTGSGQVVLDEDDGVVTQDFTLLTARAEVSIDALDYIVLHGESRTKTLTLTNTGSLDLDWDICEQVPGSCTDIPWLSADVASGILAPGDSQIVEITVDGALASVGIYFGALNFISKSGRKPQVIVQIEALITAYRQGVNAGSCREVDDDGDSSGSGYDGSCLAYVDDDGDEWAI
ncbi:MAG: S8 family serine peptidase, partial [Proteobacteria bacterium]|nr:S8 family serine peptidase [Pseudomonadota bacterium]